MPAKSVYELVIDWFRYVIVISQAWNMDQYRALPIVSLATAIRALKPEENVTYYVLQYSKNLASCWNLKDILMDT